MDPKQDIISPGTILKINGNYQNKYPVKITIEFLELDSNGEWKGDIKKMTIEECLKNIVNSEVVEPKAKPSKKIKVLKNIEPEELGREINIINQKLNTTIRDLDFLLKLSLEKNNTECAIKLIEFGSDVNYIIGGKNSIIEPLKNSNYELVEILIDNGFKFNDNKSVNEFIKLLSIKNDLEQGHYSIFNKLEFPYSSHYKPKKYINCCRNKSKEFIKFILKCYHFSKSNYDDLFISACEYNYFNVIKFLFEEYGTPEKKCFCDKTYDKFTSCETHLSIACKNNHFELVKYLLDKGMKTYFPHNDESSLILKCLKHKNKDIISILVDYGLDINYDDGDRNLLFTSIKENRNIDFIKFLVSKGAKPRPSEIDHILFYKSKDIFVYFVEECTFNIDVIINNITGDTSLIVGAKIHDIFLVKYLLNKGANIHIKNNSGKVFSDYLTEEERFQLGPLIYPGAKIKGVKKVEL